MYPVFQLWTGRASSIQSTVSHYYNMLSSFDKFNKQFCSVCNSSGITLSTLDESHVTLVHEMWKFGMSEESARMIHNMITRFPSCCVLDAEANPVSWILTYDYGALGVLYTFPEHRGKSYAKVLISTMAKKFQAQGYPIFCFIEEENVVSYRLFKYMGFTADPSCRFTFLGINQI